MHCISASLCFWIYTIIQETLQTIHLKKLKEGYYNSTTTPSPMKLLKAMRKLSKRSSDDDDSDEMDDDDEDDDDNEMEEMEAAAAATSYYGTGKTFRDNWDVNYGCEKTTDLTEMINFTTPYLYPFSIEYNLLIVGVWILLWENIGKIELHTHIPSVEVTYEEDNSKGFSSNLIIYVDCHSSNRGLFAGLLMTVSTVISIILFFIFTSSQKNVELGMVSLYVI